MNILVVGGGVAGLATGWKLAGRGARVTILEKGLAGQGATWASAGMLAPGAELAGKPSPLSAFAEKARARWRDFAAELEAASGIAVGYHESGSLIVADCESRACELQALAASSGAGRIWLTSAALRIEEPLLSEALLGALLVAGDAQVDNRHLGEALAAAAVAAGACLREGAAVQSLIVEEDRIKGVTLAEGPLPADAVVLATGAWLNRIAGLPQDAPLIRPARGQMAALAPPVDMRLPKRLIWGEEIYLVPRGSVLFAGATVEDAGFDPAVTHAAKEELLAAAARLIPRLRGWRLQEMWAGLRPRTFDDQPVLGASRVAGLYYAGGQFRNGILFAPALADAVCSLVLDNVRDSQLAAFDPARFAKR